MRLLFTALACIISVSIMGQKTYIPDDSFEQYLIWLELDEVLDDSVLTSNIIEVTELNLAYSSIHDLTGLESFISLDTLTLSELIESNLIEIDFSILPKLKYLDLYNQEGQISSININENDSLVYLNVAGNALNNINVNNNTLLESLILSDNQINTINLENNEALKYINVDRNELGYINLENNDNIVSLSCSFNSISELDLSNKTHLESINCEDNNIDILSLNNSQNIKTLWCSRNNIAELDLHNKTELNQLFAGDNLLSSIDVSSCISMIWIWLYSNQLTSLNVANGNNTFMTGSPTGSGLFYIPDFTNNPDLTCIQVDNVEVCEEWWNTVGYPIFNNPNGYVAIDNQMYFSLDCSTNIKEIENTHKVLVNTTDALGREVTNSTNQMLFYIYDDGSVEKKFIIQ